MADKKQGREIAAGQSVFVGGKFYVAGEEDELHAEMSKEKTASADFARLTQAGVVRGFGAKGVSEADLASDPTIQAGESDAVMEGDDEMAGPEMSETVHRDGLYSAEGRKGSARKRGK